MDSGRGACHGAGSAASAGAEGGGTDGVPGDGRAREVLRRYGLRGTRQRIAMVRLLLDADAAERAADAHVAHAHVTAQRLHERLASEGVGVDPATVYRTLTRLVEAGLVHTVAHGPDAVAYGLAITPHHHAVCVRCGAVSGIPADVLAPGLRAVCEAVGFSDEDCTVAVRGVCAACRG